MLTPEDFTEVFTDGFFTGFACIVFDDLCIMEDDDGYMYWYTRNSQGVWRLLGNSGYDYFFTLPQGLTILERLVKEYNLEFSLEKQNKMFILELKDLLYETVTVKGKNFKVTGELSFGYKHFIVETEAGFAIFAANDVENIVTDSINHIVTIFLKDDLDK